MSEAGQHLADSYNSLAEATMNAREVLSSMSDKMIEQALLYKCLSFLAYACEHPARRKRQPVDVQKMIDVWAPLVVKLATCHDVDERDVTSAALDEQLAPIIAAPVTQIREFYRGLTKRLKEDQTVPWAIWRLWEVWGENVLDKIDREQLVCLKKELATKIAERSIEEIPKEDWLNSMIGALQWRSPEKLEAIDKALDEGHKPRVRGRESCLFLEVGEAGKEATVLL